VAKAAQNAAYNAEYVACLAKATTDCEVQKSSQNALYASQTSKCEADRETERDACEILKATDVRVCETQRLAAALPPRGPGLTFATAAADGSVALWRDLNGGPVAKLNLANAQRQAALPENLRLSADGNTLLVKDVAGTLYAIAAPAERASAFEPTQRFDLPLSPALNAELAPDGKSIVTVDGSSIVRVYQLDARTRYTKQLAEIHGHGDVVHLMAMSPDGRYLATASLDGRLRLTNLDLAVRFAHWPLYNLPAAPSPIPMTAAPHAAAR
jgi:WD40 repeat protein